MRARAIAISSIHRIGGSSRSPPCTRSLKRRRVRRTNGSGFTISSPSSRTCATRSMQDRCDAEASEPEFFYDERGSELFEAITKLPEYYPTRTEMGIFEAHLPEIAELLGRETLLVEYGSGSSRKIRLLLEVLQPRVYMPVDISRDHLLDAAERLAVDFPGLEIHAVCADFTAPLELPWRLEGVPVAGFFPGSSIGNFERAAARASSKVCAPPRRRRPPSHRRRPAQGAVSRRACLCRRRGRHRRIQSQCARSSRARARRRRRRGLRSPRVLRRGARPDRDAPRRSPRAGPRARWTQLCLLRGRDDPHGELLQVRAEEFEALRMPRLIGSAIDHAESLFSVFVLEARDLSAQARASIPRVAGTSDGPGDRRGARSSRW